MKREDGTLKGLVPGAVPKPLDSQIDESDSSSPEMEEETEIYVPTSSNIEHGLLEEKVESQIKTEDVPEAPATPLFVCVEPLQMRNGKRAEQKDEERKKEVNTNDKKYNIMDICRACLVSDSTLRPLSGSLRPAYWWICGVNRNNMRANGDKKIVLCVRCRKMLHNAHKFRRQCRVVNKHFAELEEHSQFASSEILDALRKTLKLQNQLPTVINPNEDTTQVKEETECAAEVTSRTPEVPPEPEAKTATETPSCDVKQEVVADSLPLILSDSDDNYDDKNVTFDTDDSESDDELLSKMVNTSKAAKEQSKKGITKKKVTSKLICEKNAQKKAMVPKRKKLIVSKKNGRPPSSVNENLFDKYMETTVLSFEQQKDIIMQRKECPTYESAPYKCELCYKTYLAKSTYESHVMQHSSKCGEFACPLCHMRLRNKYKLSRHLSYHRYLYRCKQCLFKSQRRTSATQHITKHQGKTYSCDLCSTTYDHKSTYMSHIRIHHPSSHVCQLCGYSFVNANGVKHHVSKTHQFDDKTIPDDGPLCSQCDTRFVDDAAFQKHLKVSTCATTTRERNSCQMQRAFDPCRRKHFTRDQTTVRRNRTVFCEQCNQEMPSFSEYLRHFSLAHPNEKSLQNRTKSTGVLCEICGKMFSCGAVLEEHMPVHDTEGKRNQKCDDCGKTYKTKMALSLHKKVHAGIRFTCELCGRKFTQQGNRDRHFKYAHTDVKNVKCEFCDKLFKSNEHRNTHMAYVHMKRPYPKRDRRREGQRMRKQTRENAMEDVWTQHQ